MPVNFQNLKQQLKNFNWIQLAKIIKTHLLNVDGNENNVANANTKLIYDQKSVSDERCWRCNPPQPTWPLFKRKFHTLRIWQKRPAMLLAQSILRPDQYVKAISANEANDGHVDQSVEPTGIVECCTGEKISFSYFKQLFLSTTDLRA